MESIEAMRQLRQPLLCCLLGLLLSACASDPGKSGHFIDASRNILQEFEPIYPALQRYFGDAVPERIWVTTHNGSTSQFNINKNTVLISTNAKNNYCTVGHESSHLSLAAFTKGASARNEFRFFDEGFAKIFDAELCKRSDAYKQQALKTARARLSSGELSFAQIQKWSVYFGDPSRNNGKANWWAYEVGSSFNYYVIDTYGIDVLLAFFRAVGSEGDLNLALQSALKKDQTTVEREWQSWLDKT